MEELEIGKVEDYFAKIGVAGIQLTGEIAVGDTIHIKGHTTDLTEMVMSICCRVRDGYATMMDLGSNLI